MPNDPSTDRADLQPTQRSIVENPVVRTLAMGGAGLFALTTAALSIWREFYNEVKGFRPFADYEATRTAAIEAAYKVGKTDPSKVPALVKIAQKTSRESIAAGMQQIGIPDGFFAGTLARARRLALNNFSDIALRTVASLAVALGSWWLFQRSMAQRVATTNHDAHTRESNAPPTPHTLTTDLQHQAQPAHTKHRTDGDAPSSRVQKSELEHAHHAALTHAAQHH